MPLISLVMPYYRNPRMLARHMESFAHEWTDDLKRDVEVVIVDDGSPPGERAFEAYESSSKIAADFPWIRIFRALADTPWHQHAARNLGAAQAETPWLLMTDIDHLAPPALLSLCLELTQWPYPAHHTFGRVDLQAWQQETKSWRAMPKTLNDRGKAKPHVNSFFLSKIGYWTVGGYDEDYCGLYGTDIEFRRRLAALPNVHHPKPPLIRVSRDVIADASTRDVQRKEGREPGQKKAVAERKTLEGRADKITTLAFEWTRDL